MQSGPNHFPKAPSVGKQALTHEPSGEASHSIHKRQRARSQFQSITQVREALWIHISAERRGGTPHRRSACQIWTRAPCPILGCQDRWQRVLCENSWVPFETDLISVLNLVLKLYGLGLTINYSLFFYLVFIHYYRLNSEIQLDLEGNKENRDPKELHWDYNGYRMSEQTR